MVNERKDGVERGGLTGSRFTGHQDGHAIFEANPDVGGLLSRHGAPFDELNDRDGLFSELTNGERRPEHGYVV